jgi:hypothetical protein
MKQLEKNKKDLTTLKKKLSEPKELLRTQGS